MASRPKRVTRRAIRDSVRRWRERLLLHDWTIQIDFGDCGTGVVADMEARPEYRGADLTFNLDLLTPDELEETVLHELLHCWTWGLWSAADDAARSDGARELARREHEGLTTKLSQVVAVAYLNRAA